MAIELEKLNIVITSEAKEATNALDSLIDKLKDIRAALGAFSANTQGVKSNTEALQSSLNGTTQEAKRVASGLSSASASANGARESLRQTGASVKQMGDSFHTANGKVGKLFTTIKRVATMRLIRWAIRQLVNAAKEGLEILIEWDRTFGNNTSYAAKTVDELSAKWREVKKSIGAALMPLIQILQPLLNLIMDGVIAIANAINQALRFAQGFSTYMKATYINTSNTTKAAKELRRVLFGFDELNVLNGNGGTGAAGSISPIEFKVTNIDPMLKEVLDNIKNGKLLEAGDNYLDFNNYLNPKNMEEADKKVKNWIKNAFGIEDDDLKAIDEKIMTFFGGVWEDIKGGFKEAYDISSTQFGEAWNNTKSAWKGFKDFWYKNVTIPWKEEIAQFYDWIISNHPQLAKFLGFTKEKLEAIRLEIKVATEQDKQTTTLEKLVETGTKVSGIGINLMTKTKLDNNIKQVIGLVGTDLATIGMNIAASAGKFASGGDPEMGTLFWAGENGGAEVVATSPSGTGVMNMKQMQDAVSSGNVQVVNAIGAMTNILASAINNKDTNAYLDGQMITDNVLRRANGMARATGQPVLVR